MHNRRELYRIRQSCPECKSADILQRRTFWKCNNRKCGAKFTEPVAPKETAPAKPVKNIAPLTYRQQIMREILAANASAGISVGAGGYYGKPRGRKAAESG